jgi:hypothetical protein
MRKIIFAFALLLVLASGSMKAIITDKEIYHIGETVRISIDTAVDEDYSLQIRSPSNIYRFLGVPASTIYRPAEEGRHFVEILQQSLVLERIEFSVSQSADVQSPSEKTAIVRDSKGRQINTGFFIVAQNRLYPSSYQELDSLRKYDIEITPDIRSIRKIRFMELEIADEFNLGIEDLEMPQFVKSYAIDPTMLNFTEAFVTATAIGNTLYKCADWDFENQACLGTWERQMSLEPGQEYTFSMTNADPGYGETGDMPEPHPVQGYVFHRNNVTRAENLIPVRIINNNNAVSVYTQVYAPPLPQHMGAYSADIYGATGDSITVRAWNLTYYGETHSSLLAETTNVNVSLNTIRNSETNVTITSPMNNSFFNTSRIFNVEARVQVLGNDGENCHATVSLSDDIAYLTGSQSSTISLGNIAFQDSVNVAWEFFAQSVGTLGITVNASCDSDGTILEKLNHASASIILLDQIKPEITLFYPEEGAEITNPVQILFNVSDYSGIQNCSLYLNSELSQTIYPENLLLQSFNMTLDAGTYYWYVGCYDNAHNYNATEIRQFILPSWHFYYGNISSRIALTTSQQKDQYSWDDQETANLYIVETGSQIGWHTLQALGRDINNQPVFNDFHEADISLSLDGFSDSINNSFTLNYQPVKTVSLSVYNQIIENVPVINSTNIPEFFTGILWDTSDGGTEYDGSQDLVFVTRKELPLQGRFGTYEYEIKVPATLKNHKLSSGTVSFYIEIT